MAKHGYYNMIKKSKLVVRHTQTIVLMKQLFSTRFNKPNHRRVHCFS
ncbi:unnamed protein product, partial [Rotaria sp. Silwood1]